MKTYNVHVRFVGGEYRNLRIQAKDRLDIIKNFLSITDRWYLFGEELINLDNVLSIKVPTEEAQESEEDTSVGFHLF